MIDDLPGELIYLSDRSKQVLKYEAEADIKVHDKAGVGRAFDRAEASLAKGAPLEGTGFWPAVNYLRRDAAAAAEMGERAASIDRQAFEKGVRLRLPASVGILGLSIATVFGVVAIWLSGGISALPRDLAFLAGFGALEIGTHTLAHWIVGRFIGIKFTHVFIGGPPPPRPGAKIDYASYLKVAPSRRALMHASGAVVTKIIPFVLIPVGSSAGVSGWVLWILLTVGISQIATDVLFSTKSSDWKRVKRELAAAKVQRQG